MRIGGAGYKSRSVANSPKSIKWKRFRVLFGKSRLLVECILGDGCPLNPCLLGKPKRYALERLKPRELHRPDWYAFSLGRLTDDRCLGGVEGRAVRTPLRQEEACPSAYFAKTWQKRTHSTKELYKRHFPS